MSDEAKTVIVTIICITIILCSLIFYLPYNRRAREQMYIDAGYEPKRVLYNESYTTEWFEPDKENAKCEK